MKTFVCPACGCEVKPDRLVDSDGKAAWWHQCTNPECQRCYGFPIYEHQMDFYGTLDAVDPGLEPWPEEDPLKLTVAMQYLCKTTGEGALAALIALSLILAVLTSLVNHTSSGTGI